ncbi:hypothetical protein [Eisenbergiella sp.]|uniref:hypothetical protein n=1 Tax=Eisenbergiella sp. TaxID=1924109 RepID=UPI00207EA798|nr:hypothetical protein [Eisenbergiella sp.]BDF48799.1 hypothetical protein CE91St56_59220 [Lachnospiraceae bacterium]GKH44879.1 hypothetical protein CE91St57_58530 [Lachnospiraceae bacterium]
MMGRTLTEQKVLKKLGIDDFRQLTKDKVITMASLLDKMDPEVAKKALEQFPDFANTVNEILAGYKDTLDKGLVSNDESVKAFYDISKAIIESLQKELDKDGLDFEEKKYIMEQMKEISEKVDKKDSENKRFITAITAIGSVVILGGIGILASTLGGNTKIEFDNQD